ncbi:hypothetical protein L2E82_27161 [Cichorium intybus]|uniref:Uncharacterized protein n=1 Tax=Cichorium intybus TaxID=13427 RepID=A0ACB9CSH4_CICIN|nr:hypothetical protein L2E82_27161 [Cichorium intybus]
MIDFSTEKRGKIRKTRTKTTQGNETFRSIFSEGSFDFKAVSNVNTIVDLTPLGKFDINNLMELKTSGTDLSKSLQCFLGCVSCTLQSWSP